MKQCFIHINTPELREKILNKNIPMDLNTELPNRNYGLLFNGKMIIGVPFDLGVYTIIEYLEKNDKKIQDCGTDENFFLDTIEFIYAHRS